MKNNPPASASNTSAASPAHASGDPGWPWLATVAGAATCLGLAAWVLPLPLVEPLEPEPVADPPLGPAELVPDVPVLPDPPPPDDPDDAVPTATAGAAPALLPDPLPVTTSWEASVWPPPLAVIT
jgi:hypothetical protein